MKTDLWQYLKSTAKPIVLYGMGNGADKIIDTLASYAIDVKGVFASDGFLKRKIFRGFLIKSYSELKEEFGDMIVLVAFGSSKQEVLNNIKRISLEQEIFVPDVPVYGGGLFNREYVSKNVERFKKIYSLLADERSRKTFENIVYYKLSGKADYLFECEKEPDEAYRSFLKLTDTETFVDLGAYNGDTIIEFVNRTENKYSAIFAAEPDSKSFRKLKENTKDINGLNLFNVCVSDSDGIAQFAMRGGRNSSLGEGLDIPCLTVDSMLGGNKATFIKYDVEGEEAAAIKGSKNTILNWAPKLKIACYHRTEDLLAIPEEVLSIRDDYKIYLRHNPYLPAWDTDYYFI